MNSVAAVLPSDRATLHPMRPRVFALVALSRTAFGIDDRLRRQSIRPGQTLRGRASHRARSLLQALWKIPKNTTSIVRVWQCHVDNNELVELSILRYKSKRDLAVR